MRKIDQYINSWLSKPKIEDKLSWHEEKGSLRYAANSAFLALIAYD
jgi:hypothetical protein